MSEGLKELWESALGYAFLGAAIEMQELGMDFRDEAAYVGAACSGMDGLHRPVLDALVGAGLLETYERKDEFPEIDLFVASVCYKATDKGRKVFAGQAGVIRFAKNGGNN